MSTSNSSTTVMKSIVDQVRSGTKDRSEAYNELKNILQSTRTLASNNNNNDNNSPETNDDETNINNDSNSAITPKFSNEDRRNYINKLIESKRKALANDKNNSSLSVDDSSLDITSNSAITNNNSTNKGNNSVVFGVNSHKTPSKTPVRRQSVPFSSTQMRSKDDLDVRQSKIAQTESSLRFELFKECTFRPSIKKLPKSYGASKNAEPFHDRVNKWQKELEQNNAKRLEMNEVTTQSECTFKPKINASSAKAVLQLRGNAAEKTNERLYKSSDADASRRQKLIEEEIKREKLEEEQECTFQPKLKENIYSSVKSKFDQPVQPKLIHQSKLHSDSKHCTFTPKIKDPSPTMASAQQYLSENIVARLTRNTSAITKENSVHKKKNDSTERQVIDVASFMSGLGSSSSSNQYQTPGSKKPNQTLNTETPKSNVKGFEDFMNRQQKSILQKNKYIVEGKELNKPDFNPKFESDKKITDATTNNKGLFLERLERDVLKRFETEKKILNSPKDKNLFKPQLSSKAEKLRSRSVDEMSNGDLLRRQTLQRMMKMRSEQEELAEYTFQPELSVKAQKSGQSKLFSSEDPSKMLEWHKTKQDKLEEERIKYKKEKEDIESEGCTFTPVIKECPAYVKRIAKSMSVVKAARISNNDASLNSLSEVLCSDKPLWK